MVIKHRPIGEKSLTYARLNFSTLSTDRQLITIMLILQ